MCIRDSTNHSQSERSTHVIDQDSAHGRLIMASLAEVIAYNQTRNPDDPIALSGVEANLLWLGGKPVLDVSNDILSQLDFVIASIHKIPIEIRQDPHKVKELYLLAAKHPHVSAIAHIDMYLDCPLTDQDWLEIFTAMAQNNVFFELNMKSPLKNVHLLELAIQAGVRIIISPDLHRLIANTIDYQFIKQIKESYRATNGNLCEQTKELWTYTNRLLSQDCQIYQNYPATQFCLNGSNLAVRLEHAKPED